MGLALSHFLLFTPESLNESICKQLKQLFQPCCYKQLEEGMQATTPVGFAVEKCFSFHTLMGFNCFRPWMKTNTGRCFTHKDIKLLLASHLKKKFSPATKNLKAFLPQEWTSVLDQKAVRISGIHSRNFPTVYHFQAHHPLHQEIS